MSGVERRCAWVPLGDQMYVDYHDVEWGVPVCDDRTHFEMLVLEGAQAGLSWSTILHRRDGYRRVFANFDPHAIAAFGPADVERLMGDTGIVRNRAKIEATIGNARAMITLAEAGESLSEIIWGFVDGRQIIGRRGSVAEVPAVTPASTLMSKELKRRGFRFVGPTTCYAHMQAAGVVNDHTVDCMRFEACCRSE
jgi:DNA-3-methyladenine glycosylase I